MPVNETYLIAKGFKRDKTCPSQVVRYEKTDAKMEGPYVKNRRYWISVTLGDDGEQTRYGVANFYGNYGHIEEHRSFEKAITTQDFEKFVDPACDRLPEGIRTTRNRNTH